MKITTLIAIGIIISFTSNAQKLTPAQTKQLAAIEEEIKDTSRSIVQADDVINRYRADSVFTRGLVKALRIPNSFYYPFDSFTTVSRQYAPDSTFRIFTWHLEKDSSSFRQKGAIQMRTNDGSLKLFPLFDISDDTENPVDSVRSNKRWIGAIYYKIILKTFANKNYYTLLGFDANNFQSNKKWMEVLSFDEKGEPVFGGRFFQYPNEETKPPQPAYRFCLEYKWHAAAVMNYDAEMDALILSHLVSTEKKPSLKHTLVPYGDYERFKWVNGKWTKLAETIDYVPEVVAEPKQPSTPAKKEDGKKKVAEPPPSPYRITEKNKKEDPRKKEEY